MIASQLEVEQWKNFEFTDVSVAGAPAFTVFGGIPILRAMIEGDISARTRYEKKYVNPVIEGNLVPPKLSDVQKRVLIAKSLNT